MKVIVFSSKHYDQDFFVASNLNYGHELEFLESRLHPRTASLAAGFEAACVFVNDQLDRTTLEILAAGGTHLIALRCAGFNNVDLKAAADLGITVVRVPEYSPHAVAEHTIALILTLNRKIHRAYNRVREGNFSLDGLLGFDLHGSTVGVVGTGKIGAIVASMLKYGFGCRVLAYDLYPNSQLEAQGIVQYVELQDLLAQSDLITLHCPLTPETHHIINATTIDQMKAGVMLVNTSRGALVDSEAVIQGLKSGQIGYLGLDVYEQEADLFFEDLSNTIIQDDVFQRLLTFPNVTVTGHQAFFTKNALQKIAETTLANISMIEQAKPCPNQVSLEQIAPTSKR